MTTFCSARRRTAIHSSAIVLLVATAMLSLTASANAGNYTAKFCAQGVTADQDKGPFERAGNETVFALSNSCGNLNGLRVSHNAGNGAAVGTEARWLAERPDGITVAAIAYKAAAAGESGGYRPQVIGDDGGGLDVINGGGELGGSFSDFSVNGDMRQFGVRLICSNGNNTPCPDNPASNPEVKLRDVTYTLTDPAPPSLSVTGGTLFQGEVQSGGQSVAFTASDSGSGVRRVVVNANGQPAGEAGGDCVIGNGFGLTFKPCDSSVNGEVALNTAGAPWHSGINKVQTCVEDYSGEVTCSKASKVRVLNGCATSGAPAQTLELEWPGKRNAATQARQGRARHAVANLYGANGTPLAGAAVCLSRSIPDGRGRERVMEPGALTGADGSIAVKVRGASSRTVYATYWIDGETVVTDSIEMNIAPRIKLGLRPGRTLEAGEKMLVTAQLRGKWKQGRKVCFFADQPGNDKIGCGSTGDGGRAKLPYKPEKTGRTYFYAKVPNQKGYPYVNAQSAKKHAKVVD